MKVINESILAETGIIVNMMAYAAKVLQWGGHRLNPPTILSVRPVFSFAIWPSGVYGDASVKIALKRFKKDIITGD